jgi:hypothetical protein
MTHELLPQNARSSANLILKIVCGIILSSQPCCSLSRHSPDAEVKRFIEALQKGSDHDINSFFSSVNLTMGYTISSANICPDEAELNEKDNSFFLNACPVTPYPHDSSNPGQFIVSLMILQTPPGDFNYMEKQLATVLGPPAGLNAWRKPTWFVSGGMVIAHESNVAYYYSSAYTGDHLDQVENTQLPRLQGTSVLQWLTARWSPRPVQKSSAWKGCMERAFDGPDNKAPQYYGQWVTLYSPSESNEISGLQVVLRNLGDDDPTAIFQNLLTSWGISGADDVVKNAVAELSKAPRQGGTIVTSQGNYVVTLRTVQVARTTYLLDLWRRTDFRPELRRYVVQFPRWQDRLGRSVSGESKFIGDPPDTPCHQQ